MGDVALINSETGEWGAGPLPDDTKIEVLDGYELVALATGYPDTVRYEASTKSCVAIPAATAPALHQFVDMLVSAGTITAAQGDTIKAA